MNHIVVAGDVTSVPRVKSFLSEFYSPVRKKREREKEREEEELTLLLLLFLSETWKAIDACDSSSSE